MLGVFLSAAASVPSGDGGLEVWMVILLALITSGTVGSVVGHVVARRRTKAEALAKLAEASSTEANADKTLEITRASVLDMIQEGTEQLRIDLRHERNARRELQEEVETLRFEMSEDRKLRHRLKATVAYLMAISEQAISWISENYSSESLDVIPEPLRSHVDGMPLDDDTIERRHKNYGPPHGVQDRRHD